MSTVNNIWNLAEAFVSDTMSEGDRLALNERLAGDAIFAAEFHECLNLLSALQGSAKQKHFRTMLRDIHDEQHAPAPKVQRTIPLRTFYLRAAAIAAGIALITSFTTYWALKPGDKVSTSQYNVLRGENNRLRGEIENIKRSQNQLIRNIQQNKTSQPPQADVKYTGSGFAITNDGYFVTNYHVIDGADSVYIQDHVGDYHKVIVIAYDPNRDIAILKVKDPAFKFGPGDVPYSFAHGKAQLGTKVYSIGYPEEQMAYKEGYISGRNGYQGDSAQYSLDMSAHPGQSGAPVLDAKGNVLAIVTAKGNIDDENTYAVNSNALLQLVRTLPDIRLPRSNKLSKLSREKQIEKLAYYTCSVKVYKK